MLFMSILFVNFSTKSKSISRNTGFCYSCTRKIASKKKYTNRITCEDVCTSSVLFWLAKYLSDRNKIRFFGQSWLDCLPTDYTYAEISQILLIFFYSLSLNFHVSSSTLSENWVVNNLFKLTQTWTQLIIVTDNCSIDAKVNVCKHVWCFVMC